MFSKNVKHNITLTALHLSLRKECTDKKHLLADTLKIIVIVIELLMYKKHAFRMHKYLNIYTTLFKYLKYRVVIGK